MKKANMMKGVLQAVLGSCVLLSASNPAAGVSYRVEDIVGDGNPANVAIGESQFGIDVTDGGDEPVLFVFRNTVDQLAFHEVTSNNLGRRSGARDIAWDKNRTGFRIDSQVLTAPRIMGPDERLGPLFDRSPGFTSENVSGNLNRRASRTGIQPKTFPDAGGDAVVPSGPISLPAPPQSVPDTTSTLTALGCSVLLLLGMRWKVAG